MSIRDRVILALGGDLHRLDPAPASSPGPKMADPKTVGYASGGLGALFGSPLEKNREKIKKWRAIYDQDGLVTEAINSYPLYMFMNGYRLEGTDKKQVKVVEDTFERIDFDKIKWEGVIDALVSGDGFQEVVGTVVGSDIGGVVTRPAEQFRIQTDKKGNVTGYKFFNSDVDLQGTTLGLDDILHTVLFTSAGRPYGDSLIGRGEADIMRDIIINEGSAAAIQRHGYPKYHIKAGSPEHPAADADLSDLDKLFQSLNSQNEFTTRHDVDIKNIDAGVVTGLDVYNAVSIQRVCASLGVPGEILGIREGTTDNTAIARLQTFYSKISTLQARLARHYNKNLIDRILVANDGKAGSVKIVFNKANQPTESELVDLFTKVIAWDPLNSKPAIMMAYNRLDWMDLYEQYKDEGMSDVPEKDPLNPLPTVEDDGQPQDGMEGADPGNSGPGFQDNAVKGQR